MSGECFDVIEFDSSLFFPSSYTSLVALSQFTVILSCTHCCWRSRLFCVSHEKLNTDIFTLSDVTCKTNAQADIVLLVDGSWSIGRLNFKTIRSFIARMVGVFEIGPDRVQVGRSKQMIFALKRKTHYLWCCSNKCFFVALRSCTVQWRPKDRMALVRSSNQGLSPASYFQPALQRRKHLNW